MESLHNGKMALLYIMKELLEKTDEEHALNARELADVLAAYGIKADRRTIYSDIEVLRDFGMDIIKKEDRYGGYFIGSREFELPELKILVDVVQSSGFITEKKSRMLINKLEKLTSVHEATKLNREVFLKDRLKGENESIFYSVDSIYDAMDTDKKISFEYGEWTVNKKFLPKGEGALYSVSPWALIWADENYYLIAFDDKDKKIKHYRVEKMLRIKTLDDTREGKEAFGDFDPAGFAKKTFGMYGGEEADITLKCHDSMAGIIIDRFGTEVMMIPADKGWFSVKVKVAVSPQFYGWISAMGDRIELASPQRIRKAYKEYINSILKKYR